MTIILSGTHLGISHAFPMVFPPFDSWPSHPSCRRERAEVFVMATGFLLATCCSDPGIIPRREACARKTPEGGGGKWKGLMMENDGKTIGNMGKHGN